MGNSTDDLNKDIPFPDLNISDTYYNNSSIDNLVNKNAPTIFQNFRS